MAATLVGVLGPSALQVVELVNNHEAVPAPILPRDLEEQTVLAWVLTARLSNATSQTAQVNY